MNTSQTEKKESQTSFGQSLDSQETSLIGEVSSSVKSVMSLVYARELVEEMETVDSTGYHQLVKKQILDNLNRLISDIECQIGKILVQRYVELGRHEDQ